MFDEVQAEDEFDDEEEGEVDGLEVQDANSESEEDFDEKGAMTVSSPVHRQPIYMGKDGNTKWKKHSSSKTIRTRQQNIIKRFACVKLPVKDFKSPLKIWNHFFLMTTCCMLLFNVQTKKINQYRNILHEKEMQSSQIVLK